MTTPPTPQHSIETLDSILNNTTVSSVAPNTDEFIVVKSSDSVKTALQALIKNQIFSAPVQNAKGQFIGILSALDVMTFIIDLFSAEDEDDTGKDSTSPHKGQNIFSIISNKNSKYLHSTVSHVLDHLSETTEPYEHVKHNDSLKSAMELFAKGLHRLVITDDNNEPVGFLTQSAVVKFLTNKLGVLGAKTIKELQLGTRPCIVVGKETRTIDAFSIMRQKQISGIGVVDNSGALIGNLSSRDLNAINDENLYNYMFLPVGAFISTMKQMLINEDQPLISVSEDSKLAYVVSRMAGNRIHRIYITNGQQKAVGVISMRDTIRCVLNQVQGGL